MSRHAAALSPHEGAAAGAAQGLRARLGRQLHLVRRLADKGLEIAQGLWRTAGAVPGKVYRREPPVDLNWLHAVHAKVYRALRMACLLKARLLAELRKPDSELAAALEPAGEPPHDADAADAEARPEPADRVDYERADSLPPDRLYRYVMTRPVDELIAEICADLGLAPDWLREAEAEHARRHAADPPAFRGEPPTSATTEGAARAQGGEDGRIAQPPWIARERGAYGSSRSPR